jgi:hypothetical protein
MKFIYSKNITLTTDPLIIKLGKASEDGSFPDGVIPNNLHIASIRVELVTSTDVIDVKGVDDRSDWVEQDPGDGFGLERFMTEDRLAFYVKAHSGTVSVKLLCEGN